LSPLLTSPQLVSDYGIRFAMSGELFHFAELRGRTPRRGMRLAGHSGCIVSLLGGSRNLFVRKAASTESYNARLEAQMIKQIGFRRACGAAPEVLASGIKNGLFYFDMEYVSGSAMASLLRSSPASQPCRHRTCDGAVESAASQIGQFLSYYSGRSNGFLSPSVFGHKLDEIENLCSTLESTERTRLSRILATLRTADWSEIPAGDSHGDLTLENMILQPSGRLMLIDFLDGPLSSHWLDYGKLHQDLTVRWFLRGDWLARIPCSTATLVLLRSLGRYLHRRLDSRFLPPKKLLRQILAFQLLRAVPYASAGTRLFLLEKIERTLHPGIHK
jgi:hypothetical protein